ncbi:MAG TPA: SMC-Scp complex subunit ScpB [Clostridiales bacterium]|nr:SMC-Scp complex subunit ScpB [Clostridiales bacterium]
MDQKKLISMIETLLFSSGDRLTLTRMADVLETDVKTVKYAVRILADELQAQERGIRIREIDNGYQMHSAPENHEAIARLYEVRRKQGLSQACYEVLSIIAYKQPVTRIQIERIRGTASDSAISKLAEKGLIWASGRLDAPGRPILYETTQDFLRVFGFASLKDLPIIDIIDVPGMIPGMVLPDGHEPGIRDAAETLPEYAGLNIDSAE